MNINKLYKYKIFFLFVIGYSLLIVSFSGCKKKEKTNPCAGQEATSAKFQILEPIQACGCPLDSGAQYKYFPTDTVFVNDFATFSALYKMSSYNWHIGQDTASWHTQSFGLYFNNPVTVNVNLIVKNNVSKSCFPNDKGADTANQTLAVIQGPNPYLLQFPQIPLMGNYLGHDSSKPDINYTVSVKYDTNSYIQLTVNNFPNGCSYPWGEGNATDLRLGVYAFSIGQLNSTSFAPGNNGSCKVALYGWGKLQSDHKTLIIDYSYAKDTSRSSELIQNRIHDKFIGTKIK